MFGRSGGSRRRGGFVCLAAAMTLAVTAVPAPAFAPVRAAEAAMPRTQADAVPIAPCLDTGEVPLGGEYDVYFIHTDHRGAPVFLTDEAANVVWTTEYDPFGNALCDWGRVHQDGSGRSECVPNDWVSGERVEMNLRLPGQYYDEESGLYYNWHRYYDPKTGRYLTPDGRNVHADSRNSGFNKSYPGKRLNRDGVQLGWDDFAMNPYVYTDGNPLIRIDPYGLWYIGGNVMLSLGKTWAWGLMGNFNGVWKYTGTGYGTPMLGGEIVFGFGSDPSEGHFWSLGGNIGGPVGGAGNIGNILPDDNYNVIPGNDFGEIGTCFGYSFPSSWSGALITYEVTRLKNWEN